MRTQRTEKKHRRAFFRLGLLLVFLSTSSLLGDLAPAGITAYAAQKLTPPAPKKESAFSVTWERVNHAASYDVRLTLENEEDGKTVTRTYSTTYNHLDLTLFAAGCNVSVSVRAIPSSNTRSKYSTSAWGDCKDKITPADNNTVSGYAEVSGDRFVLADENGNKYSGWQKVNNAWFYLDPANGNRTATGWQQMNGGTYYFEASGKMHTGWLEWEKHWYFLNPADSAVGKMVTGWFEVSPGKPYYFTENGSSEQPRGSLNETITNASYPDSNPPYQINTGAGTGTSGGQTPQPAVTNGWIKNVNDTWSYLVNGSTVKSAWKNVDGYWYYFNGDGIMQKGWQRINGAWYYLEPNPNGSNGYKYGAAWMNATTPDGYTVNDKGQWTQNGQVVTGDGSGSSGNGSGSSSGKNSGSGNNSGNNSGSTGLKQIKSVLISINVTESRGGRCRYAEISSASDCVIKSQNCSTAYADWTPGSAVTFTVELEPRSGYTFISNTTFRCSGGTVSGASGDSLSKTVRITYTTTSKLDAPQVIYITDNNELKWMPVPYARRYRVTVTGGDSSVQTSEIVTSPCVELWNYGNIDSLNMTATITALGSEGSKSTGESEKVTINDLGSYKKSHKLNGTFEYSGGIMRFKDDSGTAFTGWQQLCGNWFYFKTGGAAAGPGWFKDDSSGHWYYFDSCYRMMTGTVTDNGKTYLLNDGRRTDLPLGARIQ